MREGVLVNKPQREGIECFREGKASKQFQQTSLIIVNAFVEKDGGYRRWRILGMTVGISDRGRVEVYLPYMNMSFPCKNKYLHFRF